MRWFRRSLILGAPCGVLASLAARRALAAEPAEFVGAFRFVGGQKQRDRLEQIIDSLVDDMSFFVRPLARRRMKHANQVPGKIWISIEGAKLRVDLPGLRPISAPPDGRQFTWRDQYDEDVKVRQNINGRTLIQHFRGKEGARDILYRLNADATRLTYIVTISSRWLPRPLHYQLSFRRSG